jgi:hypothetical protein
MANHSAINADLNRRIAYRADERRDEWPAGQTAADDGELVALAPRAAEEARVITPVAHAVIG